MFALALRKDDHTKNKQKIYKNNWYLNNRERPPLTSDFSHIAILSGTFITFSGFLKECVDMSTTPLPDFSCPPPSSLF